MENVGSVVATIVLKDGYSKTAKRTGKAAKEMGGALKGVSKDAKLSQSALARLSRTPVMLKIRGRREVQALESSLKRLAGKRIRIPFEFPGLERGRKMADGMRSIGGKVGGALSVPMKVGKTAMRVGGAAMAIGGAVGAGSVMQKGFARLSSIDEAQAKLRGLGHDDRAVGTIMDNALASVKGTAFGLGEAATTGAGAVAAGMKPGAELEQMLKSVANSAAAAGAGMDEMGSIYNKVLTQNKATNEVLNQVADRGIPIYKALADTMGVAQEDVFEMARKGAISYADFEKAMTKASGTVASEMGNTVAGATANFNAALGRIGAGFLSGVFPKLAPAIQAVTDKLGPLEAKSKEIGEKVGAAAEQFGGFLKRIGQSEAFQAFIADVKKTGRVLVEDLGPLIKPAAEELGRIFKNVVVPAAKMVMSALRLLSAVIKLVAPAVRVAVRALSTVLGGAIRRVTGIFDTLASAARALSRLFSGFKLPSFSSGGSKGSKHSKPKSGKGGRRAPRGRASGSAYLTEPLGRLHELGGEMMAFRGMRIFPAEKTSRIIRNEAQKAQSTGPQVIHVNVDARGSSMSKDEAAQMEERLVRRLRRALANMPA